MQAGEGSSSSSTEPVAFRARDGVVLRGERWAAGPNTVLLLHGGGQSRWSWRGTGAALGAAGLTAITLDLRGHGDSDWAVGGGYALEDFALDVLDVIGQLPSTPALVGASLGGVASLLASAHAPQPRVPAVVLVDIVAHNSSAGIARISSFMRATVGGFATLDDAAQAIADYLPQRARRAPSEGLARTLRRAADGRWVWRWDPALLDAAFATEAVHAAPRLVDAATRLHAPCLIVRGGASDVVSREAAESLASAVPGSEHAVVEGAAHTVAGDRNDSFTAVVVDFLQRRSLWDGSGARSG
jgi:pimeloyl-ACP methyl ester carboxylesterase